MGNFNNPNWRQKRMNQQRPQQTSAPRANINVPINTLDDIVCANCSGKIFIQSFAIKHLPIIYSPENREGTINVVTGPMCILCGQIGNVKRQKVEEKDENLVGDLGAAAGQLTEENKKLAEENKAKQAEFERKFNEEQGRKDKE